MRLERLSLTNFRGFEQIEINFEPDLNVIAGVNGVGKSGILYALAVLSSRALREFTPYNARPLSFLERDFTFGAPILIANLSFAPVKSFFEVNVEHFRGDSTRQGNLLTRIAALKDERLCVNVMRLERQRLGQPHTAEDNELDRSYQELSKEVEEVNRELELLLRGNPIWKIKPSALRPKGEAQEQSYQVTMNDLRALRRNKNHSVVILFSPRRQFPRNVVSSQEPKPLKTSEAYRGALSDREVSLKDFMEWFRAQENLVDADNLARERILDSLRKVITDFLPDFRNLRLEEDPTPRLVVDKNGTPLTLNQLSDGERGLLAIIFDITRRLAIANPELEDPIAQGKAVVLIDELELHLHPSWQRQITRRLVSTFKNCQFIVTTHSPQILGEVASRCIRLLYRDNRRVSFWVPDEALGMDSNRVLQELMGVPARNSSKESELRELFELIDQERFDAARAKIEEVGNKYGREEPELTRAESLIAFLEGSK